MGLSRGRAGRWWGGEEGEKPFEKSRPRREKQQQEQQQAARRSGERLWVNDIRSLPAVLAEGWVWGCEEAELRYHRHLKRSGREKGGGAFVKVDGAVRQIAGRRTEEPSPFPKAFS